MTSKNINEYMYKYINTLKKKDEAKSKLDLNLSVKHQNLVDFAILLFVTATCYTTKSWTMIFPYVVLKFIFLAYSQVESLMLRGNLLSLEKELNSIDEDLVNVDRLVKNANNESRI